MAVKTQEQTTQATNWLRGTCKRVHQEAWSMRVSGWAFRVGSQAREEVREIQEFLRKEVNYGTKWYLLVGYHKCRIVWDANDAMIKQFG